MSTPHLNDSLQRPITTARIGLGPSPHFSSPRNEFHDRGPGPRPFSQPRRGPDNSFGGERSAGPRLRQDYPAAGPVPVQSIPSNPQIRAFQPAFSPQQALPPHPHTLPPYVQFPPGHVPFNPFSGNPIHNPLPHHFNEFSAASHPVKDKLPTELDSQPSSEGAPHMFRTQVISPEVQMAKQIGVSLPPHALHITPAQPVLYQNMHPMPTSAIPNSHVMRHPLSPSLVQMVPVSNSGMSPTYRISTNMALPIAPPPPYPYAFTTPAPPFYQPAPQHFPPQQTSYEKRQKHPIPILAPTENDKPKHKPKPTVAESSLSSEHVEIQQPDSQNSFSVEAPSPSHPHKGDTPSQTSDVVSEALDTPLDSVSSPSPSPAPLSISPSMTGTSPPAPPATTSSLVDPLNLSEEPSNSPTQVESHQVEVATYEPTNNSISPDTNVLPTAQKETPSEDSTASSLNATNTNDGGFVADTSDPGNHAEPDSSVSTPDAPRACDRSAIQVGLSQQKKIYSIEHLRQFRYLGVKRPNNMPDLEVCRQDCDLGVPVANKGLLPFTGGGLAPMGFQTNVPQRNSKEQSPPIFPMPPAIITQPMRSFPGVGGMGMSMGMGGMGAVAMQRRPQKWQADSDGMGRRVQGILNKLTPEKFEPLSDQLCNLGFKDEDSLQTLVRLIFDMALLQGHYCSMYAQLCSKLNERLSGPADVVGAGAGAGAGGQPPTTSFRRALLSKCQTEFENRDDTQMTPMGRKRKLGNIRFVGELFKQRMLPEKIIIRDCIHSLENSIQELSRAAEVDVDSMEQEIETLCQLLSTVGLSLSNPTFTTPVFQHLTKYHVSKELKFSSRIRFMIMDIIELRGNNWIPRRKLESAKKLGQIKEDVLRQDEQSRAQSRPDQFSRGTSDSRHSRGGGQQQYSKRPSGYSHRPTSGNRGGDDKQLSQAQARPGRILQAVGASVFGKPRIGFPSSLVSSQVDELPSTESQSTEAVTNDQDLTASIESIVNAYFISQSLQDTVAELIKLKNWQSQFVFEALSKGFDRAEAERNALIPLFDLIVREGLVTKVCTNHGCA
eukprot:c8976_g1_i3.p1 GENE.c8976_g1_i3~~c8976_g1_i3.p1  ORF type:complete len:1057 (+),score=175.58 c8976_g1_i3:67-3237(+)